MNHPINIWSRLIDGEGGNGDCNEALRQIYVDHSPKYLEILLNSHCPFQCSHCIYPPDYHHHNANLDSEQWLRIFEHAYWKMGLRTFMFNGRHLRERDVVLIGRLKYRYNDIQVGVITSGGISDRTISALIDANPNWVDISLDGDETDHDRQRGVQGSYGLTQDLIKQLQHSKNIEKVNILTCLTRLNAGSVNQMIRQLNGDGFSSFFITPVTLVENVRPDPALRPSRDILSRILDELIEMSIDLEDSWLEFNFFEAAYFRDIMAVRPALFNVVENEYDHLEAIHRNGNNEFHINYYPSSLTGIRELILNSNGDIIPPKVVAMGKIDIGYIFSNMLKDKLNEDFNRYIAYHPGFSFYLKELYDEQIRLRDVKIPDNFRE